MSEILSIFDGAKTLIVVTLGGIVALLAAYFSGRKAGFTQEKAKADVAAAEKETAQASAAAEKQKETIQVVKDVIQSNQSLSDDAARQRMRTSRYHSTD